MNVIIIDDEIDARNNIKYHIETYIQMSNIIGEANSVKSGLQLLNRVKVDLVFLDIQLGDGSAFDLLDQLTEIDFLIVFVTAYDQFAIKSFKYSALDYVLKPIDLDDFVNTVERINDKQIEIEFNKMYQLLKGINADQKFDKIALPCPDGTLFLTLDEIINISSNGSKTFLYTTDKEHHVILRNIKFFEELLPELLFFRTHQSHIINIQHIVRYNKLEDNILMSNNQDIPIARRRRDELLKLLI